VPRNTAWAIIREVLLTGTRIFLVLKQAYSPYLSYASLAVTMGFTAICASSKIAAIAAVPGRRRQLTADLVSGLRCFGRRTNRFGRRASSAPSFCADAPA
jgi:hypothetical protein